MAKSRTVRLSAEEEQEIQGFLDENPFFDFSSLARIAISSFIRDPKLPIKAIDSKNKSSKRQGATGAKSN